MKPSVNPRLVDIPRIYDPRGNLSFVQNGDGIVPFDIRRVYWVYDVPAGEERGAHSHHEGKELIIGVFGCPEEEDRFDDTLQLFNQIVLK